MKRNKDQPFFRRMYHAFHENIPISSHSGINSQQTDAFKFKNVLMSVVELKLSVLYDE